jgi:hypothetical protein
MKSPLHFLLLILAVMPVSAQETEKSPRHGIQIRGFAFALFENVDKLQLMAAERDLGELELTTSQLRSGISVSARSFAYGITKDDTFRSLGTVALPEKGRDFILVFYPTSTGYMAFPVRADDPEFRGNDAMVFNFTKYPLGIMLGTSENKIEPFKNSLMRPEFAEGEFFYQALFTYEKDGTYKPFNNTRWPVNPNTKALVFFFEDPSTGALTYRSVTELAGNPN